MALATAAHRRITTPAKHRRPGLWHRIAGWFTAESKRLAVTFQVVAGWFFSDGKRPAVTFQVPTTLPPDATSPGHPVPPRICAGRFAGLATPLSASPHGYRRDR